ncbi:hypothetical protein SEMRO_1628_G286970.1 [Seminavis robusta]|uniref:Uncharacterized protein n=1 Tax=Seminavis robusta TaxID=568900 RepID=A0A9N8ENH9_9STRA|nr:hypothetical protein SEMRO_1628_G286970.1 [Seminavis robusta]|eukprot:Sro1628_g286970.1 n/a (230) ;mRNA; r:10212-10901
MPKLKSLDLNFVNFPGIVSVSGFLNVLEYMKGWEFEVLTLVFLGTSLDEESSWEVCNTLSNKHIQVSALKLQFPGNMSITSMQALEQHLANRTPSHSIHDKTPTRESIHDKLRQQEGQKNPICREESVSGPDDFLLDHLRSKRQSAAKSGQDLDSNVTSEKKPTLFDKLQSQELTAKPQDKLAEDYLVERLKQNQAGGKRRREKNRIHMTCAARSDSHSSRKEDCQETS